MKYAKYENLWYLTFSDEKYFGTRNSTFVRVLWKFRVNFRWISMNLHPISRRKIHKNLYITIVPFKYVLADFWENKSIEINFDIYISKINNNSMCRSRFKMESHKRFSCWRGFAFVERIDTSVTGFLCPSYFMFYCTYFWGFFVPDSKGKCWVPVMFVLTVKLTGKGFEQIQSRKQSAGRLGTIHYLNFTARLWCITLNYWVLDNSMSHVEEVVRSLTGCAPCAFPWVAKAEEVVNMLDTVCLQPKVWNNLSIK